MRQVITRLLMAFACLWLAVTPVAASLPVDGSPTTTHCASVDAHHGAMDKQVGKAQGDKCCLQLLAGTMPTGSTLSIAMRTVLNSCASPTMTMARDGGTDPPPPRLG